jgi:hypothetical protein
VVAGAALGLIVVAVVGFAVLVHFMLVFPKAKRITGAQIAARTVVAKGIGDRIRLEPMRTRFSPDGGRHPHTARQYPIQRNGVSVSPMSARTSAGVELAGPFPPLVSTTSPMRWSG